MPVLQDINEEKLKRKISCLEQELDSRYLSEDTMLELTEDIAAIRKGFKGEQMSAKELNFLFGNCENCYLFHDLTLNVQSQYAQIDHLLITDQLEVYLLEMKNYSSLLYDSGSFYVFRSRRNEDGTINRYRQRVGSIYEQVHKQEVVVGQILKNCGLDEQFKVHKVVLLENGCSLKVDVVRGVDFLHLDNFREYFEKNTAVRAKRNRSKKHLFTRKEKAPYDVRIDLAKKLVDTILRSISSEIAA